MTTKRQLVESVYRIVKGGDIRNSSEMHRKDVEYALNRAIAQLLKVDMINVNMPFGGNLPSHNIIATYENIDVTDIDDKSSYALLPATPIAMPMGIGIYTITPCNCHEAMIPLEPGMMAMIKGIKHQCLIGDQAAYEAAGNRVKFNKTKEELGGCVTVQMLVSDVSELDEDAPMPLPEDLAYQAVQLALQQLNWRPHDDSNDSNDKI
jgi:hypothetical protein